MIVLSVYVNHGLVEQRFDIAAGRGNKTNCTVISTEITGSTSLADFGMEMKRRYQSRKRNGNIVYDLIINRAAINEEV